MPTCGILKYACARQEIVLLSSSGLIGYMFTTDPMDNMVVKH